MSEQELSPKEKFNKADSELYNDLMLLDRHNAERSEELVALRNALREKKKDALAPAALKLDNMINGITPFSRTQKNLKQKYAGLMKTWLDIGEGEQAQTIGREEEVAKLPELYTQFHDAAYALHDEASKLDKKLGKAHAKGHAIHKQVFGGGPDQNAAPEALHA